ncbi:hypothetical protein SSX86_032402 [Deinandra increscens subsp. villosa]|uniref:Uncharacterized protein n=1 Tax=Deinandra increscens subsp. villosa TaxID=3103831 RepID=A0AAP0C772_9ASTR
MFSLLHLCVDVVVALGEISYSGQTNILEPNAEPFATRHQCYRPNVMQKECWVVMRCKGSTSTIFFKAHGDSDAKIFEIDPSFSEICRGAFDPSYTFPSLWQITFVFTALGFSSKEFPLSSGDPAVFDDIAGSIGTVCNPSEACLDDLDLSGDIVGIVTDNTTPIVTKRTVVWGGKRFVCSAVEVHEEWRPDFLEIRSDRVGSSEKHGGSESLGSERSEKAESRLHGEGDCMQGDDVYEEGEIRLDPGDDNHHVLSPGLGEGGVHTQVGGQSVGRAEGEIGLLSGDGGSCGVGPRKEKRDRPKSLSPTFLCGFWVKISPWASVKIIGILVGCGGL